MHYLSLTGKVLIVGLIFVINVVTYRDLQVFTLETILIICVFFILGAYVWDMIVYYKQQLYRDIVNVNVTIFYVVLMSVGVYAVKMGWENVMKFIIIQVYAVKLAYFLNKYEINHKWHKLVDNNKKNN